MTKRDALTAIREPGAAGLRMSFTALLNAHIAEDYEFMETEGQVEKLYRHQGRVQLAREILSEINKTQGSTQ